MGNVNFYILIWKNFKLQVRPRWLTPMELLIPILLMLLLVLARHLISVEQGLDETLFEPYDINTLPDQYYNISKEYRIFYTPTSDFLDGIMMSVASFLNVTVTAFKTEEILEKAYLHDEREIIGAVVFNSNLKDGMNGNGPIEFTVRPQSLIGMHWNVSHAMPTSLDFELTDRSDYGTNYMRFGFLSIQHAVAKAFLEDLLTDFEGSFDSKFMIEMSRTPHVPYRLDKFYKIPEFCFILPICLSFLCPCAMIARNLVKEKESKLKQTLLAMGVSSIENWIAWFIKEIVLQFSICLIVTAILCIQFGDLAVLNSSNPELILLWLTLYACNITSFTLFVTTFFEERKNAVVVACMLFIVMFVPYMKSRGLFHQIPREARFIFSFLPNSLFSYSIIIVQHLEYYGKGLTWDTLHFEEEFHFEISMAFCLIMFSVSTIIYIILAWYSEELLRKEHPWYFPFMAAYWIDSKNIPSYYLKSSYSSPEIDEGDYPGVKPMIEVKNLTKAYAKSQKPIIDNIDLKMYRGQITVLLGHNCSGKSTFASMLYGSIIPTAGSITIKGHQMFKPREARKIRPLLGICPEYNTCIEDLSIEDNLFFFCGIKGFAYSDLKDQTDHVLQILDLEIKRERIVRTRSPYVKRRLSVAIALIADSQVVILDEPTDRMTDDTRRLIWDTLLYEKSNRAIFVTTSNTREAISIADRIAVLQNGKIKSYGSPMFLKKHYYAGYELTLMKGPEFKSIGMQHTILKKIPDTYLIDETEDEFKVLLPADKCISYASLFKTLEESKLKVKDMFVSEMTSQKLFDDITSRKSREDLKNEADSETLLPRLETLPRKRNDGCTLFKQHMKALLRKKELFRIRKKYLIISQLVFLPLLLVITNLMKETNEVANYVPQEKSTLNLAGFGRSTVVVGFEVTRNETQGLTESYATIAAKTEDVSLIDISETNYYMHFVDKAKEDTKVYRSKYIIGAIFEYKFNHTFITAFFNPDAYHSAPVSLLYVHNAILEYYTKNPVFRFEVKNVPLPYRDKTHKEMSFSLQVCFFWAQDILIGLAVVMSGFIVLLSTENCTNFKRQQYISGMNAFVYWLSSFIHDYVIYLIPCLLALFVLAFFQTDCLHEDDEMRALLLAFVLHGFPALLFVYCCSVCSTSAVAGYVGIFLYYLLGAFLLLLVYLLEAAARYDISETLNLLFTALMPSYCIGRSVYNIRRNCMNINICDNKRFQDACNYKNVTGFTLGSCCLKECDYCLYWDPSHFSLSVSGIIPQLIALLLQPFLFVLILIILETQIFPKLWAACYHQFRRSPQKNYMSQSSQSDSDEADKIRNSSISELVNENYYLVLKNVSYCHPYIHTGKYTLGLKKAECFGLVSLDEIGKSEMLNMISGVSHLTTGSVYVDGWNVRRYNHRVIDKIGHNVAKNLRKLNHLTIGEILALFASVRGIPENVIQHFIGVLTITLGLDTQLRMDCCNCIIQKKVAVATAIIGMPPLILLDEPTTGMDTASNNSIRRLIRQAQNCGCTIFLTASKLDDCQDLCDSVGILHKGQLSFIGSLDKLIEDYKDGFTIVLKIKKTREAKNRMTRIAINVEGYLGEIKQGIEGLFHPEAILKIDSATYINYFVPQRKNICWSRVFTKFELMKSKGFLTTYTVTETTFDHIYMYSLHESDETEQLNLAEVLKVRKKTRF